MHRKSNFFILFIFILTAVCHAQAILPREQLLKPATYTPLILNIDGYVYSCAKNEALYQKENNNWIKITTELPAQGLYYLDSQFVRYRMCDVATCNKIEKPLTIKLVDYKQTGTRLAPKDSGFFTNDGSIATVPVYETIPLKGDIRYELHYFMDNQCKEKKLFSTIITHH